MLPRLPSGWVYEGWVVYEGTPITSGRFVDVADFDMFDDYSVSTNYPPFPGEDYLMNPPMGVMFPIDLADGMSKAVISVEPNLMGVDPTGDKPFSIKPLLGNIPDGADDHVNFDMMANLAPLPSGLAVLSMDAMGLMRTIEELETQVLSLQSEISGLETYVSTWQALTALALVVGLVMGAAIIYKKITLSPFFLSDNDTINYCISLTALASASKYRENIKQST